MADYRLTRQAAEDLREIATFSMCRFGARQAQSYGDELISTLNMLSGQPGLGSDQGHVRPELRRYVFGSHSIYYRIIDDGIVVLRVLGPGQDPLAQL
ncbi:type II toxin-antitoxin system RelE/ParE family toxin [Lentisalinibacter salinarum]|uniref:type II toxin-antitoxin system RelE/ParE family toxin n=1 Tax=Lentisalinibacter salinarum TaxID=2992239 RepID=UPI00386ACE14